MIRDGKRLGYLRNLPSMQLYMCYVVKGAWSLERLTAGGRSRSPPLGTQDSMPLTSSFSGLFLDSTSTCREMVSPMLFLLDKRSSSGKGKPRS